MVAYHSELSILYCSKSTVATCHSCQSLRAPTTFLLVHLDYIPRIEYCLVSLIRHLLTMFHDFWSIFVRFCHKYLVFNQNQPFTQLNDLTILYIYIYAGGTNGKGCLNLSDMTILFINFCTVSMFSDTTTDYDFQSGKRWSFRRNNIFFKCQ